VGSSNIDPFSLLLAREANLLVQDEKFAHQLRDSLLAVVAKTDDASRSEWAEDSWNARLCREQPRGLRLVMAVLAQRSF